MKIVLVTCLNVRWMLGRVPSFYVPLNLLVLGSILREQDHEVQIIDQTLALLQDKATDGPEFHHHVAELICTARPDVVAMTTMCNSYPQTLSLAQHYHEVDPQTRIILGGPQATATDVHTLEHFPCIDAVVRGEADTSLPELLNCWENDGSPAHLAGITWKSGEGRVYRNDDALPVQDMDSLPFPAYDLYPLDQVDVEYVPIEAGRGCPFECTFCSTSRFFKRRYRVKSVERLVAEINFFHESYGFNRFSFVHDTFTVDHRWVSRFCQALIEGGYSFKWSCSARVDRVDADLLDQMAQAGCTGIFFGVETGSQRLQSVIKKRLNLEHVVPTIRTCLEHNIGPTASFITGFPGETESDTLDSFNMALDVLSVSPDTQAQMHLLAPLPGSLLHEKHEHELQFDGHSSDISLFLLADTELDMVRRYPKIFSSFYYIPTPQLDRDLSKASSAILYTCAELFIALRHAGLSIRDVLKGWVTWQHRHTGEEKTSQDYYMYHFGLDICRYLRMEVLDSVASLAPLLGDLLNYFEIKYALQKGHVSGRTIFHQFEYDVLYWNKTLRTESSWPGVVEPVATDLLFINLAFNPERGFVYLEVKVPRNQDPLVMPGDELEVRDPVKQLQTRPDLIIRNNTQKRVFATQHHMTARTLRALGLQVAMQ